MEKRKITTFDVFDAFDVGLLNDERCKEFLLKLLHTDVALCPFCRFELTKYNQEKFWKNQQAYCGYCNKKFSGSTKTILSSKKVSWAQIVMFCLLREVAPGLKSGKIAGLIGTSRSPVNRLRGIFNG